MGSASSKMSASPSTRHTPGPSSSSSYRAATPRAYGTSDSPAGASRQAASDFATLKAAVSNNTRGDRDGGSSSRTVTPSRYADLQASRNGSVATVLAGPFSKVEIVDSGEKEEGEISEDETENLPAQPSRSMKDDVGSRYQGMRASPSYGSHSHFQRRRSVSPVKNGYLSNGQQRQQRQPQSLQQKPSGNLEVKTEAIREVDKGKGKAPTPSPEPVAPAPSNISTEDAEQYMDLIRNLLHQGLSPDVLVRRGATPRYVTAVCEEIVAGTKRRKELWLGARSDSSSIASSSLPLGRSSSPEVEVSVSMERRETVSSETSAEFELIENPSPPRRRRTIRLVPDSSWTPTPPVKAIPTGPASHAIKIESYKPTPSGPRIPPSGPSSLQAPSTPTSLATQKSTVPQPHSRSSRLGPPSASLPAKPPPTGPRSAGFNKRFPKTGPARDMHNKDSVVPNYNDDETRQEPNLRKRARRESPRKALAPVKVEKAAAEVIIISSSSSPSPELPPSLSADTLRPSSIVRPQDTSLSPTPSPTPSPIPSAAILLPGSAEPASAQQELDAKNAILDMRRRVLESMRAKKENRADIPLLSPMDVDTPLPTPVTTTSLPLLTANVAERTIEQEVADLESEVMGLQAAADAEAEETTMEIDELEEGEIIATTLPPPTIPAVSTPPLVSVSLPNVRPARGVKRPNAEDLGARPTSTAARPTRKPFGAAQRSTRLLFSLDDLSDSDSDDEPPEPLPTFQSIPLHPQPTELHVETDPLAEKEEMIRRLRAQIEAKMKAKVVKVKAVRTGTGIDTPVSEVESVSMSREGSAKIKEEIEAAAQSVTSPAIEPTAFVANAVDMEMEDIPVDDPSILAGPSDVESDPVAAEPSCTLTVHPPKPIATKPPVNPPPPSDRALFAPYQPLLPRYPQLSSPSLLSTSFPQFSIASPRSPNGAAKPFDHLDKGLLLSIVLTRRLQLQPNAAVCSAELGGGRCADPGCAGLHLDRDLIVTEEDVVEYLQRVFESAHQEATLRKAVHLVMADPAVNRPGSMMNQGEPGLGTSSGHVRNLSLLSETGPTGDGILLTRLRRIGKALGYPSGS